MVESIKCRFLHADELRCSLIRGMITSLGKKQLFLFSFHGYSPCSLFMPNKHIWIGNYSKYCFMQHSSLDALHMQIHEIVIKRGEENQKRKSWEAWFASTIPCKPIKIEKSFYQSVNPQRCKQLFTPERTTREEGQYAMRENLTRTITERRLGSPYFKRNRSPPNPPHCHIPLFPCHSKSSSREPRDVAEMQHQHASPPQQQRQYEEESWKIHVRGTESGFLSAQLIKIPGTKNAGCDVRRAGGAGLICMSGRLLHLQIGSHWACLSAPLAALLAYGAIEGIHEHSKGVSLSTHWYNSLFLWLLRSV